jgi:hypothetical protein
MKAEVRLEKRVVLYLVGLDGAEDLVLPMHLSIL